MSGHVAQWQSRWLLIQPCAGSIPVVPSREPENVARPAAREKHRAVWVHRFSVARRFDGPEGVRMDLSRIDDVLAVALSSPEAGQLLEEAGESSWVRGTCCDLALALQDIFPQARLVLMTDRRGAGRVHVLVELEGRYVDGHGVQEPRSFLRLWQQRGGWLEPHLSYVSREDLWHAPVECSEGFAEAVADLLVDYGIAEEP